MSIPEHLLSAAMSSVEQVHHKLPFKIRGIYINEKLIAATMELLNDAPGKTLPQNSANAVAEKTKDGLDRRLKQRLGNLRQANIVSDVLAKAGIVELTAVINKDSGKAVKGTRLRENWSW